MRVNFLLFLQGKEPRITDLYPAALGIYGHWLAESRSENPGVIIDDYMEYVTKNKVFLRSKKYYLFSVRNIRTTFCT